MQLSKLEIKGFKSFADKITIHFDKGITGIVGPNGCGKSNIVDAIRWALGEQKISMLRSEKMENIIFNGTRNRQQQHLAEVSLTIDNTKNIIPTEYAQITVTRRLYRSGESEYLLNNVTCRLKDISDLFLDTGVSSNSYAIIELGMVDDLLTDRDNARRGLFEEAAGISKFKKRKKETLNKLESTAADIERVDDLLFEINKNMKSLEKQAKQASLYYQAREEYKQKSIRLASLIINELNHAFGSVTRQITAEEDSKSALVAQTAAQEATLARHKATMELQGKALSERQKEANDHVAKIRERENSKQIKNERLQALQSQVSRLSEQLREDKNANAQVAQTIEGLEQAHTAAQNAWEEMQHQVDGGKKDYEARRNAARTLQGEVEKLQSERQRQQSESYQISKGMEIRSAEVSLLTQEVENAATERNQQHANLTTFEGELNTLEGQAIEKRAQLEQLQHNEQRTTEEAAAMEKEIETTRERLRTAERKADACKNEYQLTKSMVENMEGFPEAIKFLKKNVTWAEQAPLLSDIISTSEQYRVAIENYLESYLSYYIAPSVAEALQAVEVLSGAGQGKANFLILDALARFTPPPVQRYEHAFPALDIVEYDAQYQSLMQYVFGDVYIYTGPVETMPLNDESTFIAPAGGMAKRRFTLSGGSIGLFDGKRIGRKKNLEKLSAELDRLSKEAEQIRQSLTEGQRRLSELKNHDLRRQIEAAQQEIRLVNDRLISLQTKKEQALQTLSTSALRKDTIRKKIEELEREISRQAPAAENALIQLKRQDEQLNELRTTLQAKDAELTQQGVVVNEQQILLHQQENKIKGIAQEILFKSEMIGQTEQRMRRNAADQRHSEQEIREIIGVVQGDDTELKAMYERKEELTATLNQAEVAYYALKTEGDQLASGLQEAQRARQRADERLMQLQNELNENKLAIGAVKERLLVEFDLRQEDIAAQPADADTADKDALREQVEKLKARMERMGPVNPMAMEAYNEIKERSDFINQQKLDLVEAKKSLLDTVSEIEGVAGAAFIDAFARIKENFSNVFRSLFYEGDECDLILVNPDNLFDSKIDIIAKPKGKKPITINQLSGGEKTLTAIALLFAIYLLKPAPFCIFDEVDAPLDDANIDKFNGIMRQFSQGSQFIVVTHNKRTMTSADVIYGITMEEAGVSKAVPVSLKEFA